MKQDLKKLFIFEYCCLGAMLLAVLAWMIVKITEPARQKEAAEDYRKVILYGNDDPDDLSILKERLSAELGQGAYQLTEKEDYLELLIRPSALGNCSVSDYLEYFLTEPEIYRVVYRRAEDMSYVNHLLIGTDALEFIFSHGVLEESSGIADSEEEADAVPVSDGGDGELNADAAPVSDGGDGELSADAASASAGGEGELRAETKGSGGDEGSAAEENVPVIPFERENRYYVKFTFPEEAASKIRKCIQEGHEVFLMKNNVNNQYDTNNISMEAWKLNPVDTDPLSFIAIYDDTDLEYGNEAALDYIFSHDTLKKPFEYQSVEDIQWRETGEESVSGSNQVDEEDLTEDYYLVQVTGEIGEGERVSAAEAARRVSELTQRLDRLGTSYAVGTTAGGQVCVKIPAAHLNTGVLGALISHNGVGIKIWNYFVSLDNALYRFDEETGAFTVMPGESALEALRLNAAQSGRDEEEIYFMAGDIPVAKCTIKNPFTEDEITFEELCFTDSAQITDNAGWFLPFVKELCMAPETTSFLSIDYIAYEGRAYGDRTHFGLPAAAPEDFALVEKKVKDVCPGAEIEVSGNLKQLTVYLHLPVDDSLLERASALCPAVYEAVGLERSFFDSLIIRPAEVLADERFYIAFDKQHSFEDDSRSISVNGVFFDGRLEEYKEEFRSRVEEDPFLSSFAAPTWVDQWVL